MIDTRKINTLKIKNSLILELYHEFDDDLDDDVWLISPRVGCWDVYLQYFREFGDCAILLKNKDYELDDIIFGDNITIEKGYSAIDLSETFGYCYEENNYVTKDFEFDGCYLNYDLIIDHQENVGISLDMNYQKEIFVDLAIDETTKEIIAIRISQSNDIE